MQATATITTNQREQNEQARVRALVRFNGLTFHSIAAASFLETAVPLHVNRINLVFAAHPELGLWMEQVWWPQRAERGRRLRQYVEATWPEFDWNAAYHEFYHAYRPQSGLEGRHAGVALEALGLCATAAQAAVFYRALASCVDEPALRALARQAAIDYAAYFNCFREVFERCRQRERVGLAANWSAILAVCRSARDLDVGAAFEQLGRHWNGARTIPELGYGEFRARMAPIIERYAALGRIERLLFWPWLKHARVTPAPLAPERRQEQRLSLSPMPAA
jgi:hypothetical protein